MTSRQKSSLNFVETFVLSGAAAIVSRTMIIPVEKYGFFITYQTQHMQNGLIPRPYKGFIDCLVQTYKYRGISPLCQGNLRECIRYFPIHALNFAFKNEIKRIFKQRSNESYWTLFFENFVSGGIAGALSLGPMYSLDNARRRFWDAKRRTNELTFNNLIDVYRKTLLTEGIGGLYRGFVMACLHAIIYRGCYFGFYDTLKPILLGQNPNFFLSFILAYGVTTVSDLIAWPFDTIRRRMMLDRLWNSRKYKGYMDCLFRIIQNEQMSGLFRGAGCFVYRSIPGAGTLAGFDLFVKIYFHIKTNCE